MRRAIEMSQLKEDPVVSCSNALNDSSLIALATPEDAATGPNLDNAETNVIDLPSRQKHHHDINHEWDIKHIEEVYAHVKSEYDEKEQIRLHYFMSNHCDTVIQCSTSKKRTRDSYSYSEYVSKIKTRETQNNHPTVTQDEEKNGLEGVNPNFSSTQSRFTVHFRKWGRKSSTRTQVISPTPISATKSTTASSLSLLHSNKRRHTDPLPPYTFCLPIMESYRVDDQPELTFVPVLEKYDDKPLSRRNILSMHQTSYREEMVLFGPKSQQEKTNMLLDTLFQRLFHSSDGGVGGIGDVIVPSLQHDVWDTIAKVTNQSRLQIIRRLREHEAPASTTITKIHDSNDIDPHSNSTNSSSTSKLKRSRLDVKYESFTDAYRKLWCRQCYIYDCNMHGLSEKPSVSVQTMLAKSKARDGYWVGKNKKDRSIADNSVPITNLEMTEMSEVGKIIFKQLYSIFEGNTEDVSRMLRVPISVVEKHLTMIPQQSDLLDVLPPLSVRKKGQYNYFSVKNYKPEWYKQYRDAKMFSYFQPCLHDDICKDSFNCTCIDNNFFCTDACSWNVNSPNFFRGCNCTAHCGKQCSCFLSKRECDPNLCQCTTCTDPPHQLITKQRCRNDNLIMNRSPSLLIGISSVSGLGLYTRHALSVGDYVGKYIGELMSQDEADRRGLIADARDCTYMFLISTDMSIDAGRKGNKLRFINHSDQPNLEPRSKYLLCIRALSLLYSPQFFPLLIHLLFFFAYSALCKRTTRNWIVRNSQYTRTNRIIF